MGEHIVPAQLPLDDAIEAGLALVGENRLAGAIVDVFHLGVLGTIDEIVLLVAFEVGEIGLRVVRKRINARRRREEFGHSSGGRRYRCLIFATRIDAWR
jgi:hypothetical protein